MDRRDFMRVFAGQRTPLARPAAATQGAAIERYKASARFDRIVHNPRWFPEA